MQENRGLAHVHDVCTEMNAVWRPTPSGDIGIDGQIEFLVPASTESTGDILGVQVKSGRSYLKWRRDGTARYTPTDKHRRYWTLYPLGMILVFHDPGAHQSFFVRVKPQLAVRKFLVIQPTSLFRPDARLELIEIAREDRELFDPRVFLASIHDVRLGAGTGELSVIDFLWCSTTSDDQFHLSIARSLTLLHLAGRTPNLSIGTQFYSFIERAVLAILTAGLVEDFREAFNYFWYEQELVPDIAAPLSTRGKMVVDQIAQHPDQYLTLESFSEGGDSSPAEVARRVRASCELAEAEYEEWSPLSALRERG